LVFVWLVSGCVGSGSPDGGLLDSCAEAVQVEPANPTNSSDEPSGLFLCGDGEGEYWRAESPASCTFDRPSYPQCPSAGCGADCQEEDCYLVDGVDACRCLRICQSDSHCEDSELCLCASAVEQSGGGLTVFSNLSVCVEERCRSSGDCPSGSTCRASLLPTGEPGGLYCTTPDDECGAREDCSNGGICAFDKEASHWKCRLPAVE
jgi:hypothetical protein